MTAGPVITFIMTVVHILKNKRFDDQRRIRTTLLYTEPKGQCRNSSIYYYFKIK